MWHAILIGDRKDFRTLVGSLCHSSNRMTYHPQMAWLWSRDCFFKFCSLPWYIALRRFVSDSWTIVSIMPQSYF